MTIAGIKPLWTAGDAARATGGRTFGQWAVDGVSIDSRTVEPGDLFVAISGPNFDGHDFVADALSRGAAAAVVHREAADFAPVLRDDAPLLLVNDTTAALEDLGRAARTRMSGKIIAVTGSVGKTGTKEGLRLALSDQGLTHASEGNLNNHWGLPLSLSRMPGDSAFGIFELGMNRAGEIERLTEVTRPHVAVITTVAEVHSEFFAHLDDIADAKAEIFSGLEIGGVAVINRDIDVYPRLADAAARSPAGKVVTFGEAEGADVRLLDFTLKAEGSEVEVDAMGKKIAYRIGVPGRHWVKNSLGVLGVVWAAGGDIERAAESLADLRGLPGRGDRHTVGIKGGSFILIDESYNASPTSMAAAIEVLGQAATETTGRRVAVIGDMLELGARSAEMHAGLLETLVENQIDLVFTTGQYTTHLWDVLPERMRGGHTPTADKLSPLLASSLAPGDVVMVKGSHGSRTGRIVEALLNSGIEQDRPHQRVANGNWEG